MPGGRGACSHAGVLCGVWPGLGAVHMAAAGSGVSGPQSHPVGHRGHACTLVSRNHADEVHRIPSPFSVRSGRLCLQRSSQYWLSVLSASFGAASALASGDQCWLPGQVRATGLRTRHLRKHTTGNDTNAFLQCPFCFLIDPRICWMEGRTTPRI